MGDIAVCNICREIYNGGSATPKQLSCGHTFCLACALQLADNRNYILCPDCRQLTYLDANRELPTNYGLLGVINQLTTRKGINQLSSNAESVQNCCSECQGSYKLDKLLQCGTCQKDSNTRSQICAECWVVNHNGHVRITRESLKKEYEFILAEFKQHGEAVERIMSDFGERNSSIADMLLHIKKQVHEQTSSVIGQAIFQVGIHLEDASLDRNQVNELNRRVTDARRLAERLGKGLARMCDLVNHAVEQFQMAALSNLDDSNYVVTAQISTLKVLESSQREEQRTRLEEARNMQLALPLDLSPLPPEDPSFLHTAGAFHRQFNASRTNSREEQITVPSRPLQPNDTKILSPLPQHPLQRPTFLDQLNSRILGGRQSSESPAEDDRHSSASSVQSVMARGPPPPRPPRPSPMRLLSAPVAGDLTCSRCGKSMPKNSNALELLIAHSVYFHDGSCILKTSDAQLCSFTASNLQWKMELHLKKTHQFTF